MALNLLSDKKEAADTAATKTSSALSSVAFRIPVPERPSPVVAEKKVPLPVAEKKVAPVVKKQQASVSSQASGQQTKKEEKGFTPLEVSPPPKADPKGQRGGLLLTGYTKPEALRKGFGVNILGAAAKQDREPPSLALLVIAVAGAFLGATLVLGVWLMLITQEEGRMSARAQTEKMTLAALSRTMEDTTAERKSATERLGTIETARALLSRHIYWTRFFLFLEAVTLPDVYYTNLAVDPAGNIRLAAIGRNFSAVARQLLAFEESADVETIHMTKAAAEISESIPGVQFDLALTVKPEFLFNK